MLYNIYKKRDIVYKETISLKNRSCNRALVVIELYLIELCLLSLKLYYKLKLLEPYYPYTLYL